MSKKKIESYIPEVMKVLDKNFPDGTISSSYNGYISSFGASIIQSGLLPTLALFENTDATTKENKEYLSHIIVQVLTGKEEDRSLLHYALNKNEAVITEQILDISVALKLSIRTFNLDKGGQHE